MQAPAAAQSVPVPVHLASRADIPESWKRRFALIDRAGGPELPRFRDLTLGERMSVNFNVLAFLFGPIYYLIKGLWRQTISYLLLSIPAFALLDALGFERYERHVVFGFAALWSARANVGYYRKVVHGQGPWF